MYLNECKIIRTLLISGKKTASELLSESDLKPANETSFIRKKLMVLFQTFQEQLREKLAPDTIKQMAIPLVFYLDDLVLKTAFTSRYAEWALLQEHFYNTTNGGTLFYKYLEKYLNETDIHPIVYQLYYFLLKDGFGGMYLHDTETQQNYLSLLENKLCL